MAAAITGALLGDGAIPGACLEGVEGVARVTTLADDLAGRFPPA